MWPPKCPPRATNEKLFTVKNYWYEATKFFLFLGPALDIEDGSSVVFAFFFAIIILWYTLDHVVFENFTRYTFGVFPVLIIASIGQVVKLQYSVYTFRNFVFAVCILAFCCFSLFFRIVFFICCMRARRRAGWLTTSSLNVSKATCLFLNCMLSCS